MSADADALARTVLRKNLKVGRGESVIIETWPHTLEFARAFVAEARRLGAQPTVLFEDESAWWDAVEAKNARAFAKLSKVEKAAIGKADAYVYFFGPKDQARLSSMPRGAGEKYFGSNEEWYDTAHKARLRGARMTLGMVPDSLAEKFGVTGDALRARLARAGAVDAAMMARTGAKLQRAIEKGKVVRIRHSNGTDLTIQLKGVHVRSDTGLPGAPDRTRRYAILSNNPTGLLMVAVDKASAVGRVVSNRAVYDMTSAKRYAGSVWTFDGGRLAERKFTDGGEEFEASFAKGGKGRDELSYFSIGLNPEGKETAPAEDTEKGAVLISVGNNTFAGGTNRSKMRGYAMVAGADIEVDGKTIVAEGQIR